MTNGCGHAHLPNPHTDPTRAAMYHEIVSQTLRLGVLTCALDAHTSARYAGMIGMAVAQPPDPMPSLRALAWEMADILNVMFDGQDPGEITRSRCTNPHHDHGDAELPPEEAFNVAAMQAFFSAAGTGHLDAAVTVLDAVHRDADEGEGDLAVVTFFANTMVSAAFNLRVQTVDPVSLFGDD